MIAPPPWPAPRLPVLTTREGFVTAIAGKRPLFATARGGTDAVVGLVRPFRTTKTAIPTTTHTSMSMTTVAAKGKDNGKDGALKTPGLARAHRR